MICKMSDWLEKSTPNRIPFSEKRWGNFTGEYAYEANLLKH